jgi:hypothetical protein
MGEPIKLVNSKTGKSQTVYGHSEAARLMSEGGWQRESAQPVESIPTEEGVHVEADTTDPKAFSQNREKPSKSNA